MATLWTVTSLPWTEQQTAAATANDEAEEEEDKESHLSSQLFQDRGTVHCCSGSHSAVARGPGLEVSVDPTHRELQTDRHAGTLALIVLAAAEAATAGFPVTHLQSRPLRARDRLGLGFAGVLSRLPARLKLDLQS